MPSIKHACRVNAERIAVHKYPLKIAKLAGKKGKGDGGMEEKSSYYARFDKEAKEDCLTGRHAYAAGAAA